VLDSTFSSRKPQAFEFSFVELVVVQVNSSSTPPTENRTVSCKGEGCENHPTCEYIGPGNYNCTCIQGFYGDNCEGECLCQNGGVCVDDGTCDCTSGFTGIYCQFGTYHIILYTVVPVS
uniref:EGF-like domain-containing protein n=1 Tax=Hucho hucho TaxID=62062 RepID=A0A4W5PIX8_9TELE